MSFSYIWCTHSPLVSMNLALIDPFQLAQDFPDSLRDQLRSGHASTLRFNRKGDYLACGRSDGKVVIYDLETMSVALKLHGHFKQVGLGTEEW